MARIITYTSDDIKKLIKEDLAKKKITANGMIFDTEVVYNTDKSVVLGSMFNNVKIEIR